MCDMSERDSKLIRATLEAWQPFSETELTEQDAKEICQNVAAYFSLLRRCVDSERGGQTENQDCEEASSTDEQ